MNSRREKIEQLLVEEPRDPFLRYSLALELEKEGLRERSLDLLNELMRDQPPYVPAYFMAGQQLVNTGAISAARAVLREGIEEARRQSDHHAAGEMSEFLASLGSVP